MLKLNDITKYYTKKHLKTYVLRHINKKASKGEDYI